MSNPRLRLIPMLLCIVVTWLVGCVLYARSWRQREPPSRWDAAVHQQQYVLKRAGRIKNATGRASADGHARGETAFPGTILEPNRKMSRTELLVADLEQNFANREQSSDIVADGASEKKPAADDVKQTCYSFNREYCPPLNLSIQNAEQLSQTHSYCQRFVELEREITQGFCGRRLRRTNPCWRQGGTTSCLPLFFILGEMKCGTTTLYQLLDKHPRVVPPLTKEPRFLMNGRFQGTTLSRYAVNFRPAAAMADGVTFDASPVYLRSRVAREWLKRWLPDAKLLVLVRNPVQRAFSHWKMGTEWLNSKCVAARDVQLLVPWRHHLQFDSMMQRGLMQASARRQCARCPCRVRLAR